MARAKPHFTKACLNPTCLRRVWNYSSTFCCRGCARFFDAVKRGKSGADVPQVEHTDLCDERNVPKKVTPEELRAMLKETPKRRL